MMNKKYLRIEERFPIGTEVRYIGFANKELIGVTGTVKDYPEGVGTVLVDFGAQRVVEVVTGCLEVVSKPSTSTEGPILNDPLWRRAGEKILSNNEGRPGNLTCSGVNCHGVYCLHCPLTGIGLLSPAIQDRSGTYSTLGELRGAMDRLKQAERASVGTDQTTSDVHQPSHYKLFQDVESIEVIARSMTVEQFHGFCFGNILKYRLRAGKKSELATTEKDLAKAAFYETLFEQHKAKCHDAT